MFALGGTTYGKGEETMAFYPPVPAMMAVDLIALSVFTSCSVLQIGCHAHLNPFATGTHPQLQLVLVKGLPFFCLTPKAVLDYLSTWFVYKCRYSPNLTKSLTYYRTAIMKFFNVGENEEESTSTLTKKTKSKALVLCIICLLMVLDLIYKTSISFFLETLILKLTSLPVVGKIKLAAQLQPLGTWYFP